MKNNKVEYSEKNYTKKKKLYYLMMICFIGLFVFYLLSLARSFEKNNNSMGTVCALLPIVLLFLGLIYHQVLSLSFIHLCTVDEKKSKLLLNIRMRGGHFYSESIEVEPKRVKILKEYQNTKIGEDS